MDDFLDRCAESDPETVALIMAAYNEGVRAANCACGYFADAIPWYL